jgi:hypothetical protein
MSSSVLRRLSLRASGYPGAYSRISEEIAYVQRPPCGRRIPREGIEVGKGTGAGRPEDQCQQSLELQVREFIYLSDRKLRQFLPDPIPKWRRLGKLRARVNAPIGSISVESFRPDAQSAKATHLEKVVHQVEQTAQWFTADDVRPGEWIFFEERFNYWVFQPSHGSAIVLFLNLGDGESRLVRLLLHGSPEHLLGGTPVQDRLRFAAAGPSPSDGSWLRDMLPVLRKVIRGLDSDPKKPGFDEARSLGWDMEDIVHALDQSNSPATAMWLAGYGRVTARVKSSSTKNSGVTFVTASPLYVELLMPPDDENDSP